MIFRPPPIYPFWLWNGKQEETEISRQLMLIKRRGIPGAAIHARTGNQIPYLSPRWMELFRYACQEARRLGLHIWIYDELGFPSGTANGRLPAKGEPYQQKYLQFGIFTRRDIPQNPLAVFPRKDGTFLVFQRKIQSGFPDFLYSGTAQAFLELVHEKYYASLKEYFGNVIQAVFTDDNVLLLQRGATLPYTDDLETTFRKASGFSLLKNLDALVENRPGYETIRLAYYRHLAERLNNGFIKPMQEWCIQHGLKFYGHLSSDEGPLDYCARSFGDPGCYMMTLKTPGCDDFLTMSHDHSYMRHPRNHFSSIDFLNGARGFSAIEVMKQASSVASQLGDGSCMSETFSSLGWGVSPEALIAHMNFLCQMGITISVPHYYAYSTALQAKRDHPASFFFQQPYFSHSKAIFAETDRSLSLTARGRNAADTLVIHPMQAAQIALDGETMDIPGNFQCEYPRTLPGTSELTDYFQEISLKLLQAHIGFEYGYESVIEKHACIRQGCFCIGKAQYTTLIFPGIPVISQTLCRLLKKAAKSGIRVMFLKMHPRVLDASRKLLSSVALPGEFYESWQDCANILPPPLLEGISHPETAVSARETAGHNEYMVVHYGQNACQQFLDLPGYVLYDPALDKAFDLPMTCTLRPGHAVHLLPKELFRHPEPRCHSESGKGRRLQGISWTIKPRNPNHLLIDAMRLPYGFLTRFDSEDFLYEPEGTITYRHLEIPETLKGKIYLCYEPLGVSLLKVNGKDLLSQKFIPCEPTTSLVKTDITSLIKKHHGQLLLTLQSRQKRPEFLYLEGQFGISLNHSLEQPDGGADEMPPEPIVTEEGTLAFGNLVPQGLPFYWGKISYTATVEATRESILHITLPNAAASAIELLVNGKSFGTLNSAPWTWTASIAAGKNTIELLLMNTAQNFFGPHHPDTQRKHFSAWRPDDEGYFSLAAFGIGEKPRLSVSQ